MKRWYVKNDKSPDVVCIKKTMVLMPSFFSQEIRGEWDSPVYTKYNILLRNNRRMFSFILVYKFVKSVSFKA